MWILVELERDFSFGVSISIWFEIRYDIFPERLFHSNLLLLLVDGVDAFTRFLKTEFSEENIEFWVACEDFKKCKEPQQIILKAKAIYEKFIQNDAPKEVLWQLKTLGTPWTFIGSALTKVDSSLIPSGSSRFYIKAKLFTAGFYH